MYLCLRKPLHVLLFVLAPSAFFLFVFLFVFSSSLAFLFVLEGRKHVFSQPVTLLKLVLMLVGAYCTEWFSHKKALLQVFFLLHTRYVSPAFTQVLRGERFARDFISLFTGIQIKPYFPFNFIPIKSLGYFSRLCRPRAEAFLSPYLRVFLSWNCAWRYSGWLLTDVFPVDFWLMYFLLNTEWCYSNCLVTTDWPVFFLTTGWYHFSY